MKIRVKNAKYIGYYEVHGERFNEWSCPDKDCGMNVTEEYRFCPYCGRKLKFELPKSSDEFLEFLRRI